MIGHWIVSYESSDPQLEGPEKVEPIEPLVDKIAAKVNHSKKVKPTKNQKLLNVGKNNFYRSNLNLTYFEIAYQS